MSVYVIADTHLSFSVEKPMDIFGKAWDNHAEILKENWEKNITAEDTIFIAGDISWGMTPAEALADLKFLNELPGTKFLMRGNHDYWWQTEKKLGEFFTENGLDTLKILNNSAVSIDGNVFCGGKGYFPENKTSKEQNEKLLARELIRLELSLQKAKELGAESPIVLLHYPPMLKGAPTEAVDLMVKYDVLECYFGHLHDLGIKSAQSGYCKGIDFTLVSGDHLKFNPLLIK